VQIFWKYRILVHIHFLLIFLIKSRIENVILKVGTVWADIAMASSWEQFGEIANVAQLTGLDAVKLIGMIVKAANTARMHKKNCRQFAQHLKLIGNLLDQLKISELKKYPETREPLEQLEDALRRSYILVNSCQDRSYLYLLAMGWNIVYQFRKAQNEIDRYLRLVPLITLVDNARATRVRVSIFASLCLLILLSYQLTLVLNWCMSNVVLWFTIKHCCDSITKHTKCKLYRTYIFSTNFSSCHWPILVAWPFGSNNSLLLWNNQERLEVIEKDQCAYTLDDEDQKVQTVFLKPEHDKEDTVVLKKTLSCSYPNFSFTEALKKENEKLQLELHHSQANMDIHQCEFIQRLLDVTNFAAYSLPEKLSPEDDYKIVEYSNSNHSDANGSKGHSSDEKHHRKSDILSSSRFISLFYDFYVFWDHLGKLLDQTI